MTEINQFKKLETVAKMARKHAELSGKKNLSDEEVVLFKITTTFFTQITGLLELYLEVAGPEPAISKREEEESLREDGLALGTALALTGALDSIVGREVQIPEVQISEELESEQISEFNRLMEGINY